MISTHMLLKWDSTVCITHIRPIYFSLLPLPFPIHSASLITLKTFSSPLYLNFKALKGKKRKKLFRSIQQEMNKNQMVDHLSAINNSRGSLWWYYWWRNTKIWWLSVQTNYRQAEKPWKNPNYFQAYFFSAGFPSSPATSCRRWPWRPTIRIWCRQWPSS